MLHVYGDCCILEETSNATRETTGSLRYTNLIKVLNMRKIGWAGSNPNLLQVGHATGLTSIRLLLHDVPLKLLSPGLHMGGKQTPEYGLIRIKKTLYCTMLTNTRPPQKSTTVCSSW